MTSFWNWAVAAYGADGVAAQCLNLQDDHDQCVPLLLWAVWVGTNGGKLSAEAAEEGADMARSWSEAVVEPLRILRKRLRKPLSDIDDAARERIRAQVKSVELNSERELMTALEALSIIDFSEAKQNLTTLCTDNLVAAAKAWGPKVPRPQLISLIGTLSEGGFLEYTPAS
ncbi:TIGR02444 family protein [Asticcacaulis sp. ZE23SCel15]|uniref:TIGR02444 family protein n=1 Tax=Asticcacaulis sp. ZE23SCel15 TaxID=3059027 RepID=UPI00265E4B73|nr:TIGR02444 family protein [Asticcacaulis sp. ZE23SCel15]WKL57465.1 TIGR02444 family protein [Asticcacaulis sp. ZE23SCel15]